MARILFCPPLYPPSLGGSETLFSDLARLWQRAGGEAVVYTLETRPGAGAGSARLEGGILVRRFGTLARRTPRLRGRLLGAVSHLGPPRWRAAAGFPHILSPGYRRFLRAGHADVDGPFSLVVGGVLPHVHFLEPAARYATSRRLPFLALPLLHTGLIGTRPDDRISGPAAATALKAAARVVVMTEAELEPLVGLGVRRESIRILPAGLEDENPSGTPGAFASRYNLGTPYLLQAGALGADKGTLTVLAAHVLLSSMARPPHLVLAGRPEDRVLRARAALPAVSQERVHLIRDPSPRDWHDALAGAALLAHPSRADSLGLVLLEAWRAGVAPIVAAAGGPGRLVRDGIDGLQVPAEDPEALAYAARKLLASPVEARRLGGAGRTRFLAEFTWRSLFPRWLRLFREMMDSTQTGPGPA